MRLQGNMIMMPLDNHLVVFNHIVKTINKGQIVPVVL